MENKPQQSGNSPPPKPWERAGSSSGPAPFKPPAPGSTSDVVEASGTARPGEIVSTTDTNTAVNRNALGRPVPTRPWEQQQTYGNTYGGAGYGSGLNYNSGYGSGMYGSSYGGYGGSYGGGGMYGNNMYRGGYGGLYGSGTGMYGGGMYNNGSFGGPMSGYGGGMGGPYGDQDPNNPFGAPPSPPGFWVSAMRVMQGVVTFFGRIAILIDQNTQAFHMFISALLQESEQSLRKSTPQDSMDFQILTIPKIASKDPRPLQVVPGTVFGEITQIVDLPLSSLCLASETCQLSVPSLEYRK